MKNHFIFLKKSYLSPSMTMATTKLSSFLEVDPDEDNGAYVCLSETKKQSRMRDISRIEQVKSDAEYEWRRGYDDYYDWSYY